MVLATALLSLVVTTITAVALMALKGNARTAMERHAARKTKNGSVAKKESKSGGGVHTGKADHGYLRELQGNPALKDRLKPAGGEQPWVELVRYNGIAKKTDSVIHAQCEHEGCTDAGTCTMRNFQKSDARIECPRHKKASKERGFLYSGDNAVDWKAKLAAYSDKHKIDFHFHEQNIGDWHNQQLGWTCACGRKCSLKQHILTERLGEGKPPCTDCYYAERWRGSMERCGYTNVEVGEPHITKDNKRSSSNTTFTVDCQGNGGAGRCSGRCNLIGNYLKQLYKLGMAVRCVKCRLALVVLLQGVTAFVMSIPEKLNAVYMLKKIMRQNKITDAAVAFKFLLVSYRIRFQLYEPGEHPAFPRGKWYVADQWVLSRVAAALLHKFAPGNGCTLNITKKNWHKWRDVLNIIIAIEVKSTFTAVITAYIGELMGRLKDVYDIELQVLVWDPRVSTEKPRWTCRTLAQAADMRAEAIKMHPTIVPAPFVADDFDKEETETYLACRAAGRLTLLEPAPASAAAAAAGGEEAAEVAAALEELVGDEALQEEEPQEEFIQDEELD